MATTDFGDMVRGNLDVNCDVVDLTVRNGHTIDAYHA